MKRILLLSLCFFIGVSMMADDNFKSLLLRGDVKMREGMYEMALIEYRKASMISTTPSEKESANSRILECTRLMNAKKPSEESGNKLIVRDTYYETGTLYDFSEGFTVPDINVLGIDSKYEIAVYSDKLLVLNFEVFGDVTSAIDLPMIYQLKSSSPQMRIYASDSTEDAFVVMNKAKSNYNGKKYREIFHVISTTGQGCYMVASALYNDLVHKIESTTTDKIEEVVDEVAEAIDKDSLSVKFNDYYVLNIDSNGNCIGDSREIALYSNAICYLMFRIEYECFNDSFQTAPLDVKVYGPDGKLIRLSSQTKPGYSESIDFEFNPGVGKLNYTFGSADPGSFFAGKYKLEIWRQGMFLYSAEIILQTKDETAY